MSNLSEWWEALSLPLKFYWALAVPFTVFFVLQMLSSLAGGDHHSHDSHFDHDASGDAGIPFQFLTLKNVVAFFTLFGWAGIAAIDSGVSAWFAFFVASVVGFLMMTVMATIFYVLAKATANGTMKFQNAVGVTGEVYLTIPASRGNIGKVQVKVQGSLRTLDAVTDDEKDIPTGTLIRVMKVANNNLLIVTAE
jgi:membrane protein implicated in regulation of membrane protease activity